MLLVKLDISDGIEIRADILVVNFTCKYKHKQKDNAI